MPSGVYIRTVKVKKQISEMMKKRFKNGWVHPLKGKHFSSESKKKMSNSHMGQKAWNKGLKGYMAGDKNPSKRFDVRKKISESKRGSKSYFWRGGVTQFQNSVRDLFEYKEWRKQIFERDDYTCQSCQQRGGYLQADHHITPFAVLLIKNNIVTIQDALLCKELWNIKNGRTLCINCHQLTGSYLNPNIVKEYLHA